MTNLYSNSIMNNFSSNTLLEKMFKLEDDRQAFIKAVDGSGTTTSRYTDLAELQDSGDSSTYNQALYTITMGEVYKSSINNVNVKINNQQLFVNSVRQSIDNFKRDLASIGNNPTEAFTKVDLCNRALTEIMNALNTKNADGKFLFGGANNTDAPCADLLVQSNLDAAGNALNNYTGATPNAKEISISNSTTIKIDLDASNKTFATLIGALNRIKNSPNLIPTAAENAMLQSELDIVANGIDVIEANIISNKEAVKNAEATNGAASVNANDIIASSKFRKSPNELAQEVANNVRSQKILQILTTSSYKITNDLLKLLSV